MTLNLVGAAIIAVLILISFLLCRLQRPKEGVKWATLLKKEIEDDAPPRPPNKIKFYYV
jgi:hypothetical protein